MKKLSLKWKLFLIASYVQLVLIGYFIIAVFYNLFDKDAPSGAYTILLVFILLLAFICLNHLLNIHAITRYFPDTPIPPRQKRLMKWVGIVYAILWALLLLSIILELVSWSNLSGPVSKATIFAAVFMGVLWLLGLFTMIMQLELPIVLNRNSSLKMKELIDNIGEE